MPASATTCFAQRSLAVMPPGLAQALGPVLQQIAEKLHVLYSKAEPQRITDDLLGYLTLLHDQRAIDF